MGCAYSDRRKESIDSESAKLVESVAHRFLIRHWRIRNDVLIQSAEQVQKVIAGGFLLTLSILLKESLGCNTFAAREKQERRE